jgi:hypothetical protein
MIGGSQSSIITGISVLLRSAGVASARTQRDCTEVALRADASGKCFWAEFDDEGLIDLLYDSPAERHAVTRALFDPAIPGGVISDATLFAALNSVRRLEDVKFQI